MLRLILLTPSESGTSTWKSLWSYCLFNCWPYIQVRVIKLIISPWFTTPNKTSAFNAEPYKSSAFISVCCQLYCRSSVTAMIQRLGWRSLEDRRRDARLTMLYKIEHELVAISKTNRLDRPTRRLRQSHDNAYQVPHCRIDIRKMSFFPRTVRDWNALPPDNASLDTLEAFKASICVQ